MEITTEIDKLKTLKELPSWAAESVEQISFHTQNLITQHIRNQEIIQSKDSLLQSKDDLIQLKDDLIQSKEAIIERLTFELAHLRRMRYGIKNESVPIEQKELLVETFEADIAAVELALEQAITPSVEPKARSTPKKVREGAGRQPLPEHLRREIHYHEPESCACGECGQTMIRIGEDVTEKLDIKIEFFVQKHVRGKYACRACQTVEAAPVPPAVIDGGMATPALLSWVCVSKFSDHLPLYRLSQMAERQGVPLSLSTLSSWVGQIGVVLEPLSDALHDILQTKRVLHADETPVQQLGSAQGKTKKAYIWAYRSNSLDDGSPIVVFDYQSSRAGSHARDFLKDWTGSLVVDDFSGYKKMFSSDEVGFPQAIEVGCWAHARRKFYNLHAEHKSPLGATAIQYIAKLYQIESEAKEMTVPEREAWRKTHSAPHLKLFKQWLDETRLKLAPGSGTAKAFDYTLRRWESLERYAYTGDLPIDNNPVENSIRPICIGKKNWLFTGSERAGKRAANIQSLLGTAKLNGIDPMAWLTDTLEKLPTWLNSRINELLPLAPKK